MPRGKRTTDPYLLALREFTYNKRTGKATSNCARLTDLIPKLLARKARVCARSKIAYRRPGAPTYGPRKPRGRAKGFKMSEETRAKIKATKAKNKAAGVKRRVFFGPRKKRAPRKKQAALKKGYVDVGGYKVGDIINGAMLI